MNPFRSRVFAAVLVAMVGLLSACGSTKNELAPAPAQQNQPAPAPKEKSLVVAEVADFFSFDPVLATSTHDRGIQHILYNALVRFDQNMTVVADLATQWKLEADGVTWTFKLRTDAKFWDGSPVRPEDVKFSIERAVDPALSAPRRAAYTGIKEVKVTGPDGLQIITKSPMLSLVEDLADGTVDVLSENFVKKVGTKEYGKTPETTMGSGPYKLTEYKKGDRAVVVPHDGYHLGKAKVDKITYRFVPEASARVAMLQTGEAQIINKVSPEETPALRKASGIKLIEVSSAQQLGYELNVAKGPLKDVRVRQALNLAIDRKAIIDSLLSGLGDEAVAPTGPVTGRATFTPFPYDPKRAKALLAEAGYPNGFELTLDTPNGRYLKDKEAAEAIQAYLKEVGISAKVKVNEWAAHLALMDENPTTNAKQAVMVGRSAPSLEYNLRRLYHSSSTHTKGSQVFTNYKNESYDQLVDKAQTTFDDKARMALYGQAQEILWKDAPFLFLWTTRQVIGTRDSVSGLVVLPRERLLLNTVDVK